MAQTVLVADVGGTNTRVAVARGGRIDTASIARFANRDFRGLDAVLARYRADHPAGGIDAAAAAIAGPVEAGRGRLTNLDWTIDADLLRAATGAGRAVVMNDLVAQGHALGHLPPSALRPILTGEAAPSGSARLVVGVGTGFNAAPVHDGPGGRVVAASECGHVALPAVTADDRALADQLAAEHGFASVEEVLAGRGILNLYRRAGAPEGVTNADFAAALGRAEPAALAAADRWARSLGMVLGDLALIHLPLGGIHLVGGVARALAPRLADPTVGRPFVEAFRDKGRFTGFMARFSIGTIEDDYAALTGMVAALGAATPEGDG